MEVDSKSKSSKKRSEELNRKHENVSITDSDRATKTTGEDYKAPKHESKEPLLQVEHENLHKVYAQTPKDVPQDKPLPTKCHDLQSSQSQNQDTMPHKSETQTLLEINPNKQESDIELKVSLATPHASPNLILSVPELSISTEPSKLKRKFTDSNTESFRKEKRLKAFIAHLLSDLDTELVSHEIEAAMIVGEYLNIPIPKTYKEAINDLVHGEEWKAAITEEINSLQANGTWIEVITPKNVNLISTKWVFTLKTHPDGTLERYKARLVARGFSQVYGEDFTETFAPTVRMDTLRVFLAMVAAENLECRQYDIKNAFTEATLKERNYLSAPAGVPVKDGHCLRALKSLYGLKQAARDWNTVYSVYLRELGFMQS